jgi:hypothetical protein
MRRTSWELPEIVAGSILVAFSALAVGGIASGIAAAASNSNPFSIGESAAQILVQATSWAGPFEAFMVLVALLVIWWQADRWSEVLEQYDEQDAEQYEDGTDGGPELSEEPEFDEAPELSEEPEFDEAPELDELWEEAVRHLLRGRALNRWAAGSISVTAAGAIVLTISEDIDQGSGDGFVWPLRISTFGELVATLVLCVAGILGAIWVRRLCNAQLLTEMEEAEEDEEVEEEVEEEIEI